VKRCYGIVGGTPGRTVHAVGRTGIDWFHIRLMPSGWRV
jgi:hypothetical protein